MILGTSLLFPTWLKLANSFKILPGKGRNIFTAPLCTPHGNWAKNKWIFVAFGYFSVRNLAHDTSEFSCPKTRLCKGTCKFFKGLIQQLWWVWCEGCPTQSVLMEGPHQLSKLLFCLTHLCHYSHLFSLYCPLLPCSYETWTLAFLPHNSGW